MVTHKWTHAFEKGIRPSPISILLWFQPSLIKQGTFYFRWSLPRVYLIDLVKDGSIFKTTGIYMWMTFQNLEQSLWVLIPALKTLLVNMNMTRDEFKGRFPIFPVRYFTYHMCHIMWLTCQMWFFSDKELFEDRSTEKASDRFSKHRYPKWLESIFLAI